MLVKCKTCEKKISEDAKNCPQCGEPDPFYREQIKEKHKERENLKFFDLSILVCIIILGLFIYTVLRGISGWGNWIVAIIFVLGSIVKIIDRYIDLQDSKEKINNEIAALESNQLVLKGEKQTTPRQTTRNYLD